MKLAGNVGLSREPGYAPLRNLTYRSPPRVARNPVEELSRARHAAVPGAGESAHGGCERCFALGSRLRVLGDQQFRATRSRFFRPNSRRPHRWDCR